jgi:hypothetical protein
MKISKYENEEIRLSLTQKAAEIEPSVNLFSKIKRNISEMESEEEMKFNLFGFKKRKLSIALLTGCIVLVFSTAVIGATMGTSWYGHSGQRYKTFPSEQKVVKDVGFAPKYTQELPGGFVFYDGHTGESSLEDDAGNLVTQTKNVSFSYKRGAEEERLTLTATQIKEAYRDDSAISLVDSYNGISLYYYDQDYKFVPTSYELTEEDIKAQEAGELLISEGASEIECKNIQGLSWYEEGIEYMLMGSDFHFTAEELVEMAKAIIDAQ